MRVAIRVDSSPIIGNGHMYRCLSLALGLRKCGVFVIFFIRDNVTGLDRLIVENEFDLVKYPSINESVITQNVLTWMGDDVQNDGFLTAQNLRAYQIDLLVIDNYAINDEWISQVRPEVKKILLIDDLYRNFEVDFVLNPNLGSNAKLYVSNSNIKYLIGPKFALMRNEFLLGRRQSLARRREASFRKVVVSIGATDPFNVTENVLEILDGLNINCEIDVDVILAENAPHIESIMKKIRNAKKNIRLLIQPNDLVDILVQSDMAIGAAGGSMLERCCLGLPSLIYVAADNQKELAKKYSEIGAAFLFEDFNELSKFFIKFNTKYQIENELRTMFEKSKGITDGLGVKRVVDFLLLSKM
jgi:UDP-2,4-diacetamido-2,4,6-trideoxy-beta-L-altropyranose hydrolase